MRIVFLVLLSIALSACSTTIPVPAPVSLPEVERDAESEPAQQPLARVASPSTSVIPEQLAF
jgi:hypothetical protein